MGINLQVPDLKELRPRIVVVGVGGAGGNAVNNMIASGLTGIDFVVANTDAQALLSSSADHRIQLGLNITEGLGAGSRPEVGEAAAEEAIEDIRAVLSGAHMVFIAAGMGGGTGTGAAAVIARTARELGILTVGVVTKPFLFEGNRRMRMAEAGIAALRKQVDTLIVIPNQNLFRIANEKTTFAEAFQLADQVLHAGIACVTDLIVREGVINLDFADVRTVLCGMGSAMMGTGEASGPSRAVDAAEIAILNPLLDDVSLRGAKGLLISISGDRGLKLYEVNAAATRVRKEVDPEANIIVGATFDDSLGDKVRVSIVASGLEAAQVREGEPRPVDIDRTERPRRVEPPAMAETPPTSPRDEPVARRLTDALGRREPDAAGAPPPPRESQAAPAELAIPADHSRSEPEPAEWTSSGDVVIELGPPQFGPLAGGGESEADKQDADGEGFDAQPPVEVRRPPRRMPEMQEFPPVAQREYQAKRGVEPDEAAPVEKRRGGLFSRWTGRGRESADSQTRVTGAGELRQVRGADVDDRRAADGEPDAGAVVPKSRAGQPSGHSDRPRTAASEAALPEWQGVDFDRFSRRR
jgi:cell division protein FtsZ